MTVDPRAASGFADAAGAYERGRPSYPPEAASAVVRELELGPASTVDGFIDRIASISWVASAPARERAALLDEVRALVHPHVPLRLPHRTEVYRCRRR